MMTTEKHAWATSQMGSRHEVRTTRPVCGCGQDLDICSEQQLSPLRHLAPRLRRLTALRTCATAEAGRVPTRGVGA